ncbi:MAG: hypothetical protein M3N13_10900 [Candidatus Eremiobacteraeota bacterium]|nr:hypothetical protein [Candidatus Eremiobacteraeota bacterium]
MGVLLETHYVIAFLLVLCAIVFSWSVTGRRVINAVGSLQVLLGVALAAVLGASRVPLPQTVWLHVLCTVIFFAAYGMAMRYGRQAGGAKAALAFSVTGLVFVFVTFYLGLRMAGKA